MEEYTNEKEGLAMVVRDIITYGVTLSSIMLEEIIKHPIGSMLSIVGLLYAYERWKTQKIQRKTKQIEYERAIKLSQEHKSGSED